ncbi:MAG: J domain-containing protein [Chloroflexota bacterium]|nr:MAG: J domain-containing protein [Chloroflexota bacterium]
MTRAATTERDRVEALRTLDLPRRARPDEIRARYIALARALHPDLNPGDAEKAARFQSIAAAYEVLRRYHRDLTPAVDASARQPDRYDPAWWRAFGHMV